VALHGTWGSFWTAYGILELLYATGYAVRPVGEFSELGFWFIAVAAITWGITAASRENKGVTTLLALLAIGSTLEAIGELVAVDWLRILAGYFMIASALVAWFVATTAMMHVGKRVKAQSPIPVAHSQSVHSA
jgi:uncharacterized protein